MRSILLIPHLLLIGGCTLWSGSGTTIDHLEEAERAYRDGRLNQAEAHFIALVDAHPSYGYGYFKLGNIHLQKGHYSQAATYFRQAIQNDPEDPRYWNNLVIAEYRQAETSLDQANQAFANQPEKLETFQELNAHMDRLGQP